MICNYTVKRFCNEDFSLIENYDKAINDDKTWDCHHRKETDENLSVKRLKELNLYYHRPASELIFLTHDEHTKLHSTGENNPMYGKCALEITKQKMSEIHKGQIPWNKGLKGCFSEETRKRWSEIRKGRHYSEETKKETK